MSERYETNERGILVKVKVVTNADSFEICSFNEWTDRLKIRVSSPASKGKANQELVDRLSSFFNSNVKIFNGSRSSKKKLLIEDDSSKTIEKIRSL